MITKQTLDSYITSSSKSPEAIVTSQEIRDKSSIFVASIYRANNVSSAKAAVKHHKNIIHGSNKATHEISAWRVMSLKSGRDGLGGPDDFELASGYDDDGEDYAGKKVLRVMESERILDAVVIVSRWYGGILLGPIRFIHIETCAREVCRTFKAADEVEEHIATLQDLDSQLYVTRHELAALDSPIPKVTESSSGTHGEAADVSDKKNVPSSSSTPITGHSKSQDYSTLLNPPDIARARRLVNARKNALRSVQSVLERRRQDATPAQDSDKPPES